MRKRKVNQKGQAVVEYIIIIVIVAIAAFVVLGAFSDRLRTMIAGVTTTLGGTADVSTKSTDIVKNLDESGVATP
jgi:Flp pilus assembly pilin Flp